MFNFKDQFDYLTAIRAFIHDDYYADETKLVKDLIASINMSLQTRVNITVTATSLVTNVRKKRLDSFGLDAFFIEYDLTSAEGLALMCIAEAMLRIPDAKNMDALIQDKLLNLSWVDHLKHSQSWFVNAATWGLVCTDKLYGNITSSSSISNSLKKLLGRLGEPIVRKAVAKAMIILGEQFILATSIDKAVARSKHSPNYLYSFDMLGEAAKTSHDAKLYFIAYKNSIAVLSDNKETELMKRPGISIKLSALCPRYEPSQYQRAIAEITEKTYELVLLAKQANISVTLDAEEAARLEMSLEIFAQIFANNEISQWGGFGVAVQAYQKRAIAVIYYLQQLAQQHNSKILVRLVKGAYWDAEIKNSQVMGFSDYPVFTRKFNTDVSYIACVNKIAAANTSLYGQFATHNAHTVAAILEIYTGRRDFEFQCLHGMGRSLYDTTLQRNPELSCRIYAPVGSYENLLPYLVRRLLENGANSSFVNRIIDKNIAISNIVADPITIAAACKTSYHPNIPLPTDILGKIRKSSRGIDFSNPNELVRLAKDLDQAYPESITVYPLIANEFQGLAQLARVTVRNPSDRNEILGYYYEVDQSAVGWALQQAQEYYGLWSASSIASRTELLENAANELERQAALFIVLAIKEAGKSWQDAVDEVREAVDFLRYYAEQAKLTLQEVVLPGPTGELNKLSYHPRGVIFCISPWNFPLAIFAGQIAAALVTGNVVIAKPAAQTVLIATKFVELLWQLGLPAAALQLLPGASDIAGSDIVRHSSIAAVMLTGSNATAKAIAVDIANRPGAILPLIAETGGMNAMIVDSTAQTEQVVQDVINSAFRSAGQRCSALRVLFLQEDIADRTISMLTGAMAELIVADSYYFSSDVGPVIDAKALNSLHSHVEYLDSHNAKLLYQVSVNHKDVESGCYFAPRVYEIAQLSLLQQEVFGPILHIIRYKNTDVDNVISQINATGFGLTFGVHSRVASLSDYITSKIKVGNIYVNRNIIGAMVGVQPFGGEGCSGTGPKAGGPNYLKRLCHERMVTINTTAMGGNASLMSLSDPLID